VRLSHRRPHSYRPRPRPSVLPRRSAWQPCLYLSAMITVLKCYEKNMSHTNVTFLWILFNNRTCSFCTRNILFMSMEVHSECEEIVLAYLKNVTWKCDVLNTLLVWTPMYGKLCDKLHDCIASALLVWWRTLTWRQVKLYQTASLRKVEFNLNSPNRTGTSFMYSISATFGQCKVAWCA
jgi:hypothetical protein